MKHSLVLKDDNGITIAIATIARRPVWPFRDVVLSGSIAARAALDHLRSIPLDLAIVSVLYPDLATSTVINRPTPQGNQMDLSHLYTEREDKRADVPRRLIAPEPNVIPEDGVVSFVVVETIADVLAAPLQSVLLFAEDKTTLLECLVEYAELFGFIPFVLSGLPTADYNAQFESKTYSLERVAYPTLVNEVIEAKRVRDALISENESSHDRERKQFTRRDGSIKELTGTRLAGAPDAIEPADAPDGQ